MEAGSAVAEPEESSDKTVPIQAEESGTDEDAEEKPQGRLLPWEPDTPAESTDTGDKELSER